MEQQIAIPQTTIIEADSTKYARKALLASACGYAMDGFDLLILGFILPAISADLGLSASQSGSLVTWTLVGAVFGGFFFGALSDRLGRVKVLTWSILLFAIFTGLCSLAQGYWDLLLYRTIAGVGLGGEFGIGMALVAEAWPAKKRARVSSYVGLGWQTGVLAAALITPWLLPLIGWRGIFAIGLLPAVFSFFIRQSMDEPAIFVQQEKTRKVSTYFRTFFQDKRTSKASIGIIVLTSVQNFGYFGLMIWMPTYLSQQFGFSLIKSGLWTSVTVVGMGIGIWLFGVLADFFGRKPIFLFYQLGAAIMVCIYSQLTSSVQLLIGGAVTGFFVNGMLGGYGALISEIYPTQVRATAQNVLFNIGRAVGGFGPLVVGAIAVNFSFSIAIAFLASIYMLDLLATIFLIPETKGIELN